MSKSFKIRFIDSQGMEYTYWIVGIKKLDKIIETAGFKFSPSSLDGDEYDHHKVSVTGLVSEINRFELEHLRPAEVKIGIRLAPYVLVEGDAVIYLNKFTLPEWATLYQDNSNYLMESYWLSKSIVIPGRHKDTTAVLYDRLKSVFPDYRFEIPINTLNELAFIDRLGRPALELKASIQKAQKRVLHIGRQSEQMCGVIIKIGVHEITTILVDLRNGEVLTTNHQPNSHEHFGNNINTRIVFSQEQEFGKQILHDLIVNQIKKMLEEMRNFSIESECLDIYRIVIVGCSEILHWLLGANIYGYEDNIGTLIFTEELCTGQLNNRLGLRNETEVIFLPQMARGISSELLLTILSLQYLLYKDYLLLCENNISTIIAVKNGEVFVISVGDQEQSDNSVLAMEKIIQQANIELDSLKSVFLYNDYSEIESFEGIKQKYFAEKLNIEIQNLGNIYMKAGINALLSDITRQQLTELKSRIIHIKL